MLPTIAARADTHTSRAEMRHAFPDCLESRRPCRSRAVAHRCGVDWTDVDQAPLAAAWCDLCPLVDACLAAALRADAGFRRGVHRRPPYGVRGGVWFDPEHPAARVPHGPVVV